MYVCVCGLDLNNILEVFLIQQSAFIGIMLVWTSPAEIFDDLTESC